MIIKIDFCKIARSEVFGSLTNAKGLWREAVQAAFDLLGEKETGGIFRDDYSIVCKDNPGQIVLEVFASLTNDFVLWSDDTD